MTSNKRLSTWHLLLFVILTLLLFYCAQLLADIRLNHQINPLPNNHSRQLDPYQILTAHYDVMGGLENLKKIKTLYKKGEIRFAEMGGEFQLWSEGSRYRREKHFSLFSQIEGDNGQQKWSVDLNNKLLIHKDPETLKRRKLRYLFDNYENADSDSSYFNLKYIGMRQVNGEKCYVIETRNSINSDIYTDFFSINTLFLIKQRITQAQLEITTFYSDFRKLNEVTFPFHSEIEILPTGKKHVLQTQEIVTNSAIDSGMFVTPEHDVHDFQFKNKVNSEAIPFLLVENNIFLTVTINGEPHYWILDSGSDASVIDSDYAMSIGLLPQGRLSGNVTSTLAEFSFVNLAVYQIQGIELYNQTILSYKNLAENFIEPEVVGILGYDFLSRFITKVDYAKRQVSFYHPDHFIYKGSGNRINAPLQNKLFMVPLVIDGTYRGNFGLDLGSFNVSLNYHFAKKNNFLNKKGVLRLSSDIADVFYELQSKSKSMAIAGYQVDNELLSYPIEKSRGTNSDAGMDGLIGNSLLRHFTLYLDYKNQQLIFEKGDDFNRDFPFDKSGMIVSRSLNNLPEIVYVAESSPAHKAGILNGDVILAINNLEGETLPGIIEITRLLQAESGTVYKFKLQRENRLITAELQLRELY